MIYQFTPNTKIQSAQENANWNNFSNHGRNFTLAFPVPGNLQVATPLQILSLPDNATITRVDLVAAGAPTGADIIVDVLKSSNNLPTFSTIFTVGPGTNRPHIAANAYSGNTTTIDNAQIVKLTDFLQVSVAQVGSTAPGNDLMVLIRGTYNLD